MLGSLPRPGSFLCVMFILFEPVSPRAICCSLPAAGHRGPLFVAVLLYSKVVSEDGQNVTKLDS